MLEVTAVSPRTYFCDHNTKGEGSCPGLVRLSGTMEREIRAWGIF